MGAKAGNQAGKIGGFSGPASAVPRKPPIPQRKPLLEPRLIATQDLSSELPSVENL